jgi:hypothetical protein
LQSTVCVPFKRQESITNVKRLRESRRLAIRAKTLTVQKEQPSEVHIAT